MDALRAHYVSELNATREPYYDPAFRDTRDKLRVTMPQDDVSGCVYLVQQLLTPGGDLRHYVQVLRLLVTRLSRSQALAEPLLKPATQALLWCLARYGALDRMGLESPPAVGPLFAPGELGDRCEEARALCFEGLRFLCGSPGFIREGLGWDLQGVPLAECAVAGAAEAVEVVGEGGERCEGGDEGGSGGPGGLSPLLRPRNPRNPPCQAFVAVPGAAAEGRDSRPAGALCSRPADPRAAENYLCLYTAPLAARAFTRAFSDWEFVSLGCLDYVNTCAFAPGARGGPGGAEGPAAPARQNILGLERASEGYPVHPWDAAVLLCSLCLDPRPRVARAAMEFQAALFELQDREAVRLAVASGTCGMLSNGVLASLSGLEGLPGAGGQYRASVGEDGADGGPAACAAWVGLRAALLEGWGFRPGGADGADGTSGTERSAEPAPAGSADRAAPPSRADMHLMATRAYYAAASAVAEHLVEHAPLTHCLAESGYVDALILLTQSPVTAPEAGRALRHFLQADPSAVDLVLEKAVPAPGTATYPGTLVAMAQAVLGGEHGPQRDLCELCALLLRDTRTCQRFGEDLDALFRAVRSGALGAANAGRVLSAASAYSDSQRRIREFLSVRPSGALAGAGTPAGARAFPAAGPGPNAGGPEMELGPVARFYQPNATDRLMPERQLGMRFEE